MSGKKFSAVIIPVMLSFFAMGFVDLVGTATNYIKADFGLSDAFANLCTTMVFFWFLIVSIPTGALMNRIGRRKTTLLSLAVTAVALLVPVLNYSAVSMTVSFSLLGDKFILLSFFGIMCHVGIDVGTNVTAPKLLMESVGMSLNDAAFATSVYFLFRTAGCFAGSFILARWSAGKFFLVSVLCMAAAMAGLFLFDTMIPIYVCVALIGFGNSNVFSIIFSKSLLRKPEKQNEVSGLMIAGLIGGAIFPPVMGLFSDMLGSQLGAVAVMSAGVVYLLCMYMALRKSYN